MPMRYSDDSYLRTLGLYDSVHWTLDRLGWDHLATVKDPMYVHLTLEFLSSYTYNTNLASDNTAWTISFRMFSQEYKFSHNQITTFLHFPNETNIPYEVPQWGSWVTNFGRLWKRLTRAVTDTW